MVFIFPLHKSPLFLFPPRFYTPTYLRYIMQYQKCVDELRNWMNFLSFSPRCFYPTPTKRDGKIKVRHCDEIGIVQDWHAFDRETHSLSCAYVVINQTDYPSVESRFRQPRVGSFVANCCRWPCHSRTVTIKGTTKRCDIAFVWHTSCKVNWQLASFIGVRCECAPRSPFRCS